MLELVQSYDPLRAIPMRLFTLIQQSFHWTAGEYCIIVVGPSHGLLTGKGNGKREKGKKERKEKKSKKKKKKTEAKSIQTKLRDITGEISRRGK